MKILSYVIPAVFLGYLYFNRNPSRNIPIGNNIVSPADGTIQSIQSNKINIFINLSDVHVQRAPQSGQITNIIDYNSTYNLIELNSNLGYIIIERWAGKLARTVTTYVEPGQYIEKGQVIGRILLGSHTSITIPSDLTIKVIEGQRVFAGETVLA